MERISFKNYQIKKPTNERVELPWRRYALDVIRDFNIKKVTLAIEDKNGEYRLVTKNYPAIIFKYACNNLEYLKGRVENAKEKFGDVSGCGNYLISTLRKNKPWDNQSK